ncbi:uncharacterized protein PODANS_4_8230 [Podospora anserina S mat+]|uniref:Podospora anserina S mat+ genomic DNA chromosome 4, supercontig 4 n=1 Tax=Podospora anserina (strain S / ATCC MYA-4624 / DSM 980 / FGSC 10383) TaxID=515849 RepID=B2AR93_PODAN|nr:uncharacterized protein PODANS_4_8230 [Podospora anserina S mat+]CAP66671.1 unnamed protein product [Podospora anserina S mat+]CDP28407.1 Putative protein of unknown function [Podospora anserina S mat+]
MQLTTLLTLATSATLASAGCFTGGAVWGEDLYNANTLMYFAVCGSDGTGTHSYNAGETRRWCYHLTDNKRVDFSIRNMQSIRDTLSTANCELLRNEIAGCQHGGRRAYTKFEFTADPNDGRCANLSYLPPDWPYRWW